MESEKNLEETNKKFFNEIAKYYDNFILKSLFIKTLKKLIKTIIIKENSRILDVGCGTGNFLSILEKKNKNLKLYGVDISKEMLKIAESRLKNSTLLINSAEEIKFKNEFDYIFSTEAFHHFSNQEKAVKNFYNALKKNGKLIIVDVEMGFIFNLIFHIIEPGNNKMSSKEDFRNLFKENNLRNIKQKRIFLIFLMTIGEK